jgi:hypothetical protein
MSGHFAGTAGNGSPRRRYGLLCPVGLVWIKTAPPPLCLRTFASRSRLRLCCSPSGQTRCTAGRLSVASALLPAFRAIVPGTVAAGSLRCSRGDRDARGSAAHAEFGVRLVHNARDAHYRHQNAVRFSHRHRAALTRRHPAQRQADILLTEGEHRTSGKSPTLAPHLRPCWDIA